jgi:hypothetical protein
MIDEDDRSRHPPWRFFNPDFHEGVVARRRRIRQAATARWCLPPARPRKEHEPAFGPVDSRLSHLRALDLVAKRRLRRSYCAFFMATPWQPAARLTSRSSRRLSLRRQAREWLDEAAIT